MQYNLASIQRTARIFVQFPSGGGGKEKHYDQKSFLTRHNFTSICASTAFPNHKITQFISLL